MARKPKPWFRKQTQTWFVTIDGQQHNLGPDKDDAEKQFYKLMAGEKKKVSPDTVAVVLDDFLSWTEENRAPKTYQRYLDFCQSFTLKYPRLRISQLSSSHITAWLKEQGWNSTTKRNAITAINRALNWAVKNRGLERNPIRGMEKPEAKRRTTVMTPEEFKELLKHANRNFRMLLIVSYDTGARPQEIKQLEACHIDLNKSRAVLPTEEAKGRKKPRVIYFPSDRSMGIIRSLCKKHDSGPLFRNRSGNAWTAYAVKCGFERIEKQTGKRFCQYDLRHTYVTRKLIAGVDSHVVANLAGHTDSSMIDKVYSHVADDHEYMLKAAKKDI